MTASPAPGSSRMVGRRAELDRLLSAWRTTSQGATPWRLVGGDAGMGKTTLLSALTSALDGEADTVTGQCMPLADEGLPLVPAAQVLRRLVDVHGRARVLDWAGAGRATLGVLVPDLGSPTRDGEERLRLFEAFSRVLEGAARTRPLLLVIEDIHWSDASTRELLRFAKVGVRAPLMVVATFRTDELTRRHPVRPWLAEVLRTPDTARLDLQPLPAGQARVLAAAALGPDADAATVDLITERADGIPYFIEELACAGAEGRELPWTLRDTLLVRVLALPESTQSLLRLASAAGNRVDHRLLAAVHGGPDVQLDADLRTALDAQVLVADETGYAFRHALLREAIHDDVLPGEHTRTHARYATAIETDPSLASPGERVHHLFAAQQLDRAFRAAVDLARDERLQAFEALSLHERALGIWDQVADAEEHAGPHERFLAETSEAAKRCGLPARSLRYADAALAEIVPGSDPGLEATIHLLRAKALSNVLQPGADDEYQTVLAMADVPTLQRLEARAALGAHHMLRGDNEQALAESTAALAEAELLPRTRDVELIIARVRNTQACVANTLGDEESFERHIEESRRLVGDAPSQVLRYYINYSDGLFVAGHFAKAAEIAQQGMVRAEELGLGRSIGAMLAGNAAVPLLALGESARAGAVVDAALVQRPPEKYLLQLDIVDASLHVWTGELDAAAERLATFRGARLEAASYFPQYVVDYAQAAAALAVERGDHDAVDRTLELVAGLDRSRGVNLWQAVTVRARSLRERGLDVHAALGEHAHVAGLPAAAAWQALVDAEAADTAEAWQAVLDHPMAGRLCAYERAYARLQLARTLGGDAGRTAWDAGYAEARRIGHVPLREAYEAVATRTGVAPGRSADLLTAREREVIALVAEGLTNGQIAARLVISTKTASVHVSNILAKLGATSRTQAATIAQRRGLL